MRMSRLSRREKRMIFVEGVASGIAFAAFTMGLLVVMLSFGVI